MYGSVIVSVPVFTSMPFCGLNRGDVSSRTPPWSVGTKRCDSPRSAALGAVSPQTTTPLQGRTPLSAAKPPGAVNSWICVGPTMWT